MTFSFIKYIRQINKRFENLAALAAPDFRCLCGAAHITLVRGTLVHSARLDAERISVVSTSLIFCRIIVCEFVEFVVRCAAPCVRSGASSARCAPLSDRAAATSPIARIYMHNLSRTMFLRDVHIRYILLDCVVDSSSASVSLPSCCAPSCRNILQVCSSCRFYLSFFVLK